MVSQGWLGPPFPSEIWVSNGLIHRYISIALGLNSGSYCNFSLTVADKMEGVRKGINEERGCLSFTVEWGKNDPVSLLGEEGQGFPCASSPVKCCQATALRCGIDFLRIIFVFNKPPFPKCFFFIQPLERTWFAN